MPYKLLGERGVKRNIRAKTLGIFIGVIVTIYVYIGLKRQNTMVKINPRQNIKYSLIERDRMLRNILIKKMKSSRIHI